MIEVSPQTGKIAAARGFLIEEREKVSVKNVEFVDFLLINLQLEVRYRELSIRRNLTAQYWHSYM